MPKVKLGNKVRDTITGFEGIAIGYSTLCISSPGGAGRVMSREGLYSSQV